MLAGRSAAGLASRHSLRAQSGLKNSVNL